MGLLPQGFHSEFVQSGDLRLHVVHNRKENEARPAIVFLHGFPEFWIAWREVFKHLDDDYLIIAPDQRGFNLSDAPSGKEAYQTKNMVADLFNIADTLIDTPNFVLAGHDWGASVAYAAAIGRPERIEKLIIANGVHPVCFQEALIDDLEQRKASQYFHILTAPDAERRMSEHQFTRTFSMFEKFSSVPWLNYAMRQEYLAAWSQPERLPAMLNWYGSSPIVVPNMNETATSAPLYGGNPERFAVTMPHLLIWGQRDQALLSSSTKRLAEFAPQLEMFDLPEADHWLLHTHAKQVVDRIKLFIKN